MCVTPLTVYADYFETLHMFCSWSEDVHMFWILSSDYFCYFFHKLSLSPFMHLLISKLLDLILGTCTLCAQLLLPFYADSFKTLQGLLSWSQFLYKPQIIFVTFSRI